MNEYLVLRQMIAHALGSMLTFPFYCYELRKIKFNRVISKGEHFTLWEGRKFKRGVLVMVLLWCECYGGMRYKFT